MAQSVTQRYREIGIRMALGADRSNVPLLVLTQGFRLTVAGVFFGTMLGLVTVRLMKNLLYGITSNGVITYALVIAVVAFVAILASLVTAKRAVSVDPVRSLRTE